MRQRLWGWMNLLCYNASNGTTYTKKACEKKFFFFFYTLVPNTQNPGSGMHGLENFRSTFLHKSTIFRLEISRKITFDQELVVHFHGIMVISACKDTKKEVKITVCPYLCFHTLNSKTDPALLNKYFYLLLFFIHVPCMEECTTNLQLTQFNLLMEIFTFKVINRVFLTLIFSCFSITKS